MKTDSLWKAEAAGPSQKRVRHCAVAPAACGLALIVLSFTAAAAAQKKAKKGTGGGGGNTQGAAVTTTLNDSTSLATYQLQSDGNESYVDFSSPKDKDTVSSTIQGGGDWVLDTKNSTTRSVSITLVPDPSNSPDSPFNGPINLPTRFIVKCHLVVNNGFFGLLPGGDTDCLMSTTFIYGGNNYQLIMNSVTVPGTDDAHITCISGDSSGACNGWTITPKPGAAYNVGRLAVLQTVRGKTTYVEIGIYDVNFSFQVTNP